MGKNKNKKFVVSERIETVQKEFFSTYDEDYYLHKIFLLKNCHDQYDTLKEHLNKDLEDVDHDKYKKMLRTEIHFLYFQMIETLFEIIFAITSHDNRDLWIALSFSGDSQTNFYSDAYRKIKDFSKDNLTDPNFNSEVSTIILNKKVDIPLLRWVFYFHYPTTLSDAEWDINIKNIYYLLKMFAKDFSDRGDYNAFKHSLRFYNSPFNMGISLTGSDEQIVIGSSGDSITYLEEKKNKDNGEHYIYTTTKPFDFERDFICCLIINDMILNIIRTRKYSFLKELNGKSFSFNTFVDVDIKELFPKTGVNKSSWTI
jgi:hypothetical protein